MKIQWNTVTRYSKLFSLVFFIGFLLIWTLYLGMRYKEALIVSSFLPNSISSPALKNKNVSDGVNMVTTTSTQMNISTWKTYANSKYKFEAIYPNDWKVVSQNETMCDAEPPCRGEEAVNIQPNILINNDTHANENYRINNGVWFSVSVGNGVCTYQQDWILDTNNKIISKQACAGKLYIDLGLFNDTPHKEFYMHELEQILSSFKLK